MICLSCAKETSIRSDQVRVYEDSMTIPSYPIGAPERNPMFNTYENYQIALSRIYPYPLLNKITDERVDVKYNGLILENEYLKICVLPEIGGRIYMARDKTNDYDFIYYNKVIKPALIGMSGAWVSGGVEWNIPHHHRVSTFMPVDYTLSENPDGSKTIWVGEYEKRHHTKWLVGITVMPGKSYVETEFRLFNATPTAKSALIWINPAVHVDEHYQVIFPPDVNKAVYHRKTDFTDWPVSRQVYRGLDFTEGVDVSWWKNTMAPTSFFAWDTKYDFLAGIDHGKRTGTVFVANRHIFPGKKMWNWGNNEVSRLWDRILTDTDGPYIELMVGAYSDNQPDYSWYHPYSMRKGKMQFYPVKEMDGIKQANKDIAANLEILGDTARIQLSGTVSLKDATLTLSRQNDPLLRQTFDVEPGLPLSWAIEIPEPDKSAGLELRIVSEEGKELLRYRPPDLTPGPHPEVYSPPVEPGEYQDIEELYLAGLRLEQFNDPDLDPGFYWDEILKRDPDNIRVNTHLGMRQLENYDYEGAEARLRRVVEKVTANYTSPKYCEPLYYLGVALMHLDRQEEAYEILNKAAWSLEWASAAYFLIAVLDCINQDFEKATQHLERSLESNQNNLEAHQLRAIILRHIGNYAEAFTTTQELLDLDPLNFVALYEQYLLATSHKTGYRPGETKERLQKLLRDEPDNYLEMATRYGESGFMIDAAGILEMAAASDFSRLNSYPMIQYHMGFYKDKSGYTEEALKHYEKAGQLQRDYCFPHLPASEKVLQAAIRKNPEDANAYYYLGNLYCDHQPQRSLDLWGKASELDPTVAIYYRNTAFVQANYQDNMESAADNIARAVELDASDPLYLEEQDRYLAYMNTSTEERLSIMEANRETVIGSDANVARFVRLLVINGRYDEAIQMLSDWHFHSAEDAGPNLHEQWTDAHILKGRGLNRRGNYEEALSNFRKVMEFPENLENVRDIKIGIAYYFMAETYKASGKSELAEEHYRKMSDFEILRGWREVYWPEIHYYKALAGKTLGAHAEADEILEWLIQTGLQMVNDKPPGSAHLLSLNRRKAQIDKRAKGYFSMGLGYLGRGQSSRAREMFRNTLATDQAHLGARLFLLELAGD
jgi:tetratricopeptide (TPR) repeat protein